MSFFLHRSTIHVTAIAVIPLSLFAGCNTLEGKVASGIVGATVYAGQTPAHELEQTFYLGVFDPQEQVPPSVYRVRVRGQASFMSRTNFASGWVNAAFVDSLGTAWNFDGESGSFQVDKVGESELAKLQTGRRQVLFGPHGFREAPRDQRLCIVMGANPDAWFEAIDNAIGVVAEASTDRRIGQLKSDVFDALATAKAEKDALEKLAARVAQLEKSAAPNQQPPADATPKEDDNTEEAPGSTGSPPPDTNTETTTTTETKSDDDGNSSTTVSTTTTTATPSQR